MLWLIIMVEYNNNKSIFRMSHDFVTDFTLLVFIRR